MTKLEAQIEISKLQDHLAGERKKLDALLTDREKFLLEAAEFINVPQAQILAGLRELEVLFPEREKAVRQKIARLQVEAGL